MTSNIDASKPTSGVAFTADVRANFLTAKNEITALQNAPGTGTVTAVSVIPANGFAGTVSNPTTSAGITLSTSISGILKGNATAISAATSGTDYSAGTSALATGIVKSTTATGALTIAVAGDFPTLNQDTTGVSAKTNALNSATTVVNVSSATAPTTGQVLTATSSTAATWQTFAGGGDMLLASAQSVTGLKTFDTTKLAVKGSSTGTTAFSSANASATNYTITIPAADMTLGSGTVTHTAGSLTAYAVMVGNSGADATVLASLGTVGQVLASNGAGVPPSFQTIAGTGDMILASVQTVTGAKTFGSAGAVGKLLVAGTTSGAATIAAPAVAASYVVTLPAATDTLVGLATSDALTNKTYNGNTFTAGTGVLTIAAAKTLTANNSITLAGTDATTMTFPPASASVGYLNIPQNSQSTAYTTVLADSGKHLLHPSADTTARIFTIDSNANVAYPIGTAITFVNQNAGGVVTIAITSDTMRLAGAGTTGSRTLAANGVATALKLTSTEWIISGTGLT